MPDQIEHLAKNTLRIRRGSVQELSLYEITDYELETLSNGSVGATYLNFAVFFITTGTAFLIALFTAQTGQRVFTIFTIMVAISYAASMVLLVLWRRDVRSLSATVKRIKGRIPAESGTRRPDKN